MQNHLYLYPNLVKVRKSKFTQAQLADLIGISQQEVSRYESGEVKAPVNYIADVADCCKVSVDYILGREQPEAPDGDVFSLYKALSEQNKQRVDERIKTLFELQTKK